MSFIREWFASCYACTCGQCQCCQPEKSLATEEAKPTKPEFELVNSGKVPALEKIRAQHGLRREQVVLIDDLEENVIAALTAGFSVIVADEKKVMSHFYFAKTFIDHPVMLEGYVEKLRKKYGIKSLPNTADHKNHPAANAPELAFAVDYDHTIIDGEGDYIDREGFDAFAHAADKENMPWSVVSARPKKEPDGTFTHQEKRISRKLATSLRYDEKKRQALEITMQLTGVYVKVAVPETLPLVPVSAPPPIFMIR